MSRSCRNAYHGALDTPWRTVSQISRSLSENTWGGNPSSSGGMGGDSSCPVIDSRGGGVLPANVVGFDKVGAQALPEPRVTKSQSAHGVIACPQASAAGLTLSPSLRNFPATDPLLFCE